MGPVLESGPNMIVAKMIFTRLLLFVPATIRKGVKTMRSKCFLLIVACLLIFQTFIYTNPVFAEEKKDSKGVLDQLFNNKQNVVDKKKNESAGKKENLDENLTSNVVESSYLDVLSKWKKEGAKESEKTKIIVSPVNYIKSDTHIQKDTQYGKQVVLSDEKLKEIQIPVNVPESGLYQISFDYYPIKSKMNPIERGIKINGKYPYFESRRIVFDRKWKNKSETFPHDEKGNEYPPDSEEVLEWQNTYAMDASYFEDEPLLYFLNEGENTISLEFLSDPMLLGDMTISSPKQAKTYEDYKDELPAASKAKDTIEIEAEHLSNKNIPYIQPIASADPGVTPFKVEKRLLNTLGTQGDQTNQLGGQKITWDFSVKETGFYRLSFKYLQDKKVNMPVFRTVLIDNELPFENLKAYPFTFSKTWQNETLNDGEGTPYEFYLEEGKHSISLIVNGQPIQRTVKTIKDVMSNIKELAIKVKMATGNNADRNRDWKIEAQIPELKEELTRNAKLLREEYKYLQNLSGKKPDEARNISMAAEQLEELASNPDEVPVKIGMLDQGSGSASQKLGDLLAKFPNQQLQLDKLYLSNEELPQANASWWTKVQTQTSKFFLSFGDDYSLANNKNSEEELTVWVNRSQQYVNMMQQLADQQFTAETGIKVKFSIMPDEQKLVLANAADKTPDVALGVSNHLPYNLALRGTVYDLSQFSDYEEISKRFSSGALLPFYFNKGVYGIPETQNFWVMFYRKDILDSLNLEVPQTWDEVLTTLPELQRNGMNFFTPLSQTGGNKPFHLTVPYLYQFGGDLFSEDGMSAGIGTEQALKGFELMTKSFSIYSMPLQVPNFYNHFREGSLPIGISDLATYIQLTSAAPELAGWWKIAPFPGVKQEDGTIARWAPGTGQSALIFKKTEKKDQSWEFIKWWTSKETQQEYGFKMEANYGPTYKWNTSNLAAFNELAWPKEDIEVIQTQWKWLKDVPHVPGDYMLEREISNAWNKIVFDGENPRKALEDAIVISNREIKKKLEEFGYIKDGKVVKEIEMPAFPEDKR